MVKNKEQIIKLVKSNLVEFRNLGINRIGLFGSYLNGSQNKNSDIDLIIEFTRGKKNYKRFIAAAELAENIVGKKVDVLTPESLSPHIGPHIKKGAYYVQIA